VTDASHVNTSAGRISRQEAAMRGGGPLLSLTLNAGPCLRGRAEITNVIECKVPTAGMNGESIAGHASESRATRRAC